VENIVYVVHCIDTEGPVYESLEATFERIHDIFGYDFEPSKSTLKKLQNKEIDLNGNEDAVANLVAPKRIQMNETWDQIDAMLDRITSAEFRARYADSYGNGWIYNWFCLDNVGYTGLNPRRRDLGYHNVFDHYRRYNRYHGITCDSIQWHFHPLPINKDAHRSGTTFLNSDHIYNILTRRVIEREWFPAVYRPGFHTERPDSNFFLEQWIPFDYANQATENYQGQPDLSGSRFGDWRRAPKTWIPYHPSHDDYQTPGNCRRWIARCLNMEARLREITHADIDLAYREAQTHGASLLSFTNHDFRDMSPEIDKVWNMIVKVDRQYPKVKFKHVTAIEGMRKTLGINDLYAPEFEVELQRKKAASVLTVRSQHPIFGPQPFLALKTRGNQFYWENLDFDDTQQWSYTFDFNNVWIDQIETIGIAANTSAGVVEVVNLDVASGTLRRTVHNQESVHTS